MLSDNKFINWILIIVIENPIQFTKVKEVPLDSSGALWATKVENNGESAITAIPQRNRKQRKRKVEFEKRKSGEIIQQRQDMNKDKVAIFFTPKYWETIPLNTQANPPEAIIKNEKRGTLRLVTG